MRRGARTLWPAVALAALIAVAYGGSLGNELVFDELMLMERDERVRELQIERIFLEALWSEGEKDERIHQYYRPLQLLPLALSRAGFGEAAWPSHLLNLVLHLANCLLVLSLYRCLLGRAPPAAVAAIFFAVHPGYSEAVLWVSDVAGLGAAFCVLAVLRLHLSPRRDRWYGWVLSPALVLCGLWFKESGVLAVAAVVLYDLVAAPDRGPRRLWRMRWRLAVLAPPVAVYFAMRLHALGAALPGMHTVPLDRTDMLINAVALLREFVATFVWPFDPNMYHDFDAVHGVANASFASGAAVLAAGAALFAVTVRRRPPFAFGIAWAFATAAPHLLIRWPQLNVFAERYLYLPSVGLFLSLGYAGARIAPRLGAGPRRFLAVAAGALLLVFLRTDVRRTGDWHDEVSIYGKTLTQSRRAELIRTNLAVRYLDLGRYDDGIALLDDLLKIDPDWHETRHNLGLLYMAKGDDQRAISLFEEARRRDPFKAETLLDLGYLYDRAGRREEAVETYLALVDRQPDHASAWYNLAVVALEQGQTENAREAARRVLALSPGDADARRILVAAERNAAAGGAPPREPALTLERCAAAKRLLDAGHVREAVWKLEAAAWLDERAPLPHHYLANVRYMTGRLADAARHEREAVRRAPEEPLYSRNLAALEKAIEGERSPVTGNQ